MSNSINGGGSITDWLTAIGTVGAVVVAILLASSQSIVRWRNRPILQVEFRNEPPFRRVDPQTDTGAVTTCYRVKVLNSGKRIARGVEGKLVSVQRNSGGQFVPMDNIDPANLHWSSQPNERTIAINRGTFEYLDVMCFSNTGQRDIKLSVFKSWAASSVESKDAEYRLDIGIYAESVDPILKRYRVMLDSKNPDLLSVTEWQE